MKTTQMKISILAAIAAAAVPALANASITITPGSGTSMALAYAENSQVVVYDNQTGDLDSSAGNMAVQLNANSSAATDWNGTFSAYTTSTSNSTILQGLQLAFRNTGTTQKTITIEVTEVGFTVPQGNNIQLLNELSGTITNAGGTSGSPDQVSFTSYADANNGWGTTTAPAKGTATSTYTAIPSTPTNPLQSFAEPTTNTTFAASGPYSLTDVLTITLSGGASANISDTTQTVAAPEPASLAMLGLGGGALLLVRRRKVAKA